MHFVIKIFIYILVFWGAERTCSQLTDGFSLGRIQSDLSFHKEWETPKTLDDAKIKIIFNQPFYYLGKGAQAFAFISEDQKYVIKFFRHNRMRPRSWLQYLPLPNWLEKKRAKSTQKRSDKLRKDFNSYKIAFDELQQETALIFAHLNKSQDLNQPLIFYDKIGIEHRISLDDYEFVLQKKADPILPMLEQWIENENEEVAKQTLSDLVSLIAKRCQKGIFDKDPNIETNFGLVENTPVQFDIGRFKRDPTRKQSQNLTWEIQRILDPLKNHLSPPLLDHLNNQIKQVNETSSI